MTVDATTMKLTATPWDVALRNNIPTTTVLIQTASPVGTRASGRRQARDATQPTAVPVRNGHAVCATPARVMPSAWLRRPIAQNTATHTTSASSAVAAKRDSDTDWVSGRSFFIGHHIQKQWADVALIAGSEAGLKLRGPAGL